MPDCFARAFTNVQIPVKLDGEVCDRFSGGEEAIRPVVFSHGLGGYKDVYSSIYHSMAANGHLVIAINHQDESCFFDTKDKDGKVIKLVVKDHFSEQYRNQ